MAREKSPPKKTSAPGADRKSGKKPEQLSLAPEPPAPRAAASRAAAPNPTPEPKTAERTAPASDRAEGPRVVELVMSASGAFKRMASGKKVPLSDQEWQLELSRMLAPKTAPEPAPEAGTEN